MKVMTILGTRPEIIRLSRVMARLDETSVVDHVLVHTGQNYDYELNQVFFDDLGIRKPDHFLECDTSSLGRVYGDILVKSEQVLQEEEPDAVLILGDTNSAIAAIIARRLHIPVFHMEAGNRSFDWRVPEETNRRIVDHIADVNLAYTAHSREHLLREGIHPQRVHVTGSPMFEVLDHYRPGIDASDVLDRLSLRPAGYIAVSLHREENVDNAETLKRLIDSLDRLADQSGLDVIMSTHPRTRRRLDDLGDYGLPTSVRFLKPLGFFDYVKMQQEAACVVSDSGTIGEEASILGFRAVTPRERIERREILDTGGVIVAGTDPDSVCRAVNYIVELPKIPLPPVDYRIDDTAERVVRLLVGGFRGLHDARQ